MATIKTDDLGYHKCPLCELVVVLYDYKDNTWNCTNCNFTAFKEDFQNDKTNI